MVTIESAPRVLVSERTILARINRQLRKEGEVMRKTRPGRAQGDLGRYYVLDSGRNLLVWHHVNIDPWARERGILRPEEVLTPER
jgi:hypothetical protein